MADYGPEVTQKVLGLIDAGKSQGEVHRLTGVSQPTISRWVNARRKAPHSTPRKRKATQTNDTPYDNIVDIPDDKVPLTSTGDPALPSAEDTAQRSADYTAELVSVPAPPQPAVPNYALSSAETLDNHETRLQVLESFVATLQSQALQHPVQHITVQSSADRTYALPSAETVQTWDDPEDAKPERWNLWLPRGIKRRIEAQAKAAGIAPSQLVQRLLIAVINGMAVHDA